MKIGDKVKILVDIYVYNEKKRLLLSKGSIHTIKGFEGNKVILENRYFIWPSEYKLITQNHPHTNIFK
jgi:hypothetical protein